MVFGGFQKLTLLDYPEKTACTLFTIGCDFACPFCQNSGLIPEKGKQSLFPDEPYNTEKEQVYAITELAITETEILEFLKTRQGLLDGVCISGGEPLIQNDLEDFIEKVKALGFLIKLDTNGNDPVKLERMINSGMIDYIAMDIKNSPKKYAQTIGLLDDTKQFDISQINKSIELLLAGSTDFEFRTTVVREFHTVEDLISIANRISEIAKEINIKPTVSKIKYYLQKFVDSENVLQKGLTSRSDNEMHMFLNEIKTYLPGAELRGIQ